MHSLGHLMTSEGERQFVLIVFLLGQFVIPTTSATRFRNSGSPVKVPEEQTGSRCSHIQPAKGETDTGVTICYNTVKDVKYAKPIIAGSDICINPVNWRTDATPATLHYTQQLENEVRELDITVTVSPEHHVLVVSGYDGTSDL